MRSGLRMMNLAAGNDLSNLSSPSATEEELDVATKSSIQHLFGGAIPKSVKKYDSRSKRFSRKSESGAIQKENSLVVQNKFAFGTWQILPSGSGSDAREVVLVRFECVVLFGRICELRLPISTFLRD